MRAPRTVHEAAGNDLGSLPVDSELTCKLLHLPALPVRARGVPCTLAGHASPPGLLGGSCAVFPALHCKATESKHLLPPMLSLCRETNDGSEQAEMRVKAYAALCEVSTILMH
eukprot:15235692-Alexandrium_andersonii.AAC.1